MSGLVATYRSHPRVCIGFLVAFLSFAAVFNTIDDPGVTWDEPYSILASERYAGWYLNGMDTSEIASDWAVNSEHPPLAKTAMGFVRKGSSWMTGGRAVPAARLSTAFFYAGLMVAVFMMGTEPAGLHAGLFGCACLLLMPRVFGHAHLAVLDLPMACMWMWTTLAFARGIESRRWSIAAGVLFGCALLTKFDGVLLVVPLVAWGLIYHGRKSLRNILAMALAGPAVFFAGWPWLWDDTWARLVDYVADKLGRGGADAWIVPSFYFGRVFSEDYPPWHYPVVMTFITVPLGILAAAGVGVVRAVRGRKLNPLYVLILFNVVFILGLFSLPFVPRYDGVRLFLSLFPFIAVLGGVGLGLLYERLPGRVKFFASEPTGEKRRPWSFMTRPVALAVTGVCNLLLRRFAAAVCIIFLLTQSVGILATHPCELSYYNLLIGGTDGAIDAGMEPTYWGDSVTWDAFDWLKSKHRGGEALRVAFFPRSEYVKGIWEHDGFVDNQRTRVVEFDDDWDFAVMFARRSMIQTDTAARSLWHDGDAAWRLSRGGVDLCRIFKSKSTTDEQE